MSPRAHALLLGAYRRYGGYEDPLTELLATTLGAYPPFARALFERAGPAAPEAVEAFSYEPMRAGASISPCSGATPTA